jgi:hypothetical protein
MEGMTSKSEQQVDGEMMEGRKMLARTGRIAGFLLRVDLLLLDAETVASSGCLW